MMTAIDMTAETAKASTVHHPLGKPGGPGLFRMKGEQLPAYIQNVAKHMEGDLSRKIQMAIGIVRNWAEGHDGHGNHVSPDVQAAAVKAIAEYDALRAKAKATPNKGSDNAAEHESGSIMDMARHVRSAKGVEHFHKPLGSVIGGGDVERAVPLGTTAADALGAAKKAHRSMAADHRARAKAYRASGNIEAAKAHSKAASMHSRAGTTKQDFGPLSKFANQETAKANGISGSTGKSFRSLYDTNIGAKPRTTNLANEVDLAVVKTAAGVARYKKGIGSQIGGGQTWQQKAQAKYQAGLASIHSRQITPEMVAAAQKAVKDEATAKKAATAKQRLAIRVAKANARARVKAAKTSKAATRTVAKKKPVHLSNAIDLAFGQHAHKQNMTKSELQTHLGDQHGLRVDNGATRGRMAAMHKMCHSPF